MGTRKKYYPFMICCLLLAFAAGCSQALHRGMLGDTYISTARPAIAITARNMPLMTAGRGTANLFWTGMMGGLGIDMWLAIYGEGGLAPLAVVAQAQTPEGWMWDGMLRRPFSVDEGTEAFNGVTYDAWTFLDSPAKDPFGGLITGVTPEGQPQLWLVRTFAARYNFNQDKIILEYREPAPAGVDNISALPLGQANLLAEFAQRAREVFTVGPCPADAAGVREGYVQGVQWQYMGQNFLGTASENPRFNTF